MRISVLGAGDIKKIPRFTSMTKEELSRIIVELGRLIASKGHELVIIPDRGVPLEVAKAYKQNNGNKVIGIVPVKDKRYGISHIKEFLPLLDERIEVEHWYDANGEIAAAGDVCVVLGMSPGVMLELAVLKYHYKYLNCKTRVYLLKKAITSIPREIEEEVPIDYIDSVKELEKAL